MGINLQRHIPGGGAHKITGKIGNELVATWNRQAPPIPTASHSSRTYPQGQQNMREQMLSDTYDIFLGGGKGSLVPLCFFHADKRLFNSFVLITSDCRLFIEELDRGDSIGERGLDRLSMLNSQNNTRKWVDDSFGKNNTATVKLEVRFSWVRDNFSFFLSLIFLYTR